MSVDYKQQYKPEHLEPFFPNEIVKMIVVVLCTVALLVFMAVLPIQLESLGIHGFAHEEEPADPVNTPSHIRPEWYFLGVYQYLKLMPGEILGISGKALGILSQMIVIALWLFLPFWYPLRTITLDKNKWRTGLLTFVVQWLMFIMLSAVLLWVRSITPKPFNDILHPMFVWPVLWIIGYVIVGFAARITCLADAFQWLKLLNTAVIFIGLQAMVFLVVLGQGLSWAINPTVAYLSGFVLFVASSTLVVGFTVSRIRGNDQRFRLKMMTALITECIALFLGLTIWAMWPPEGLFAGIDSHETRGFLFSVAAMFACAIALYAFLVTEMRTVHRIITAEEREKIT